MAIIVAIRIGRVHINFLTDLIGNNKVVFPGVKFGNFDRQALSYTGLKSKGPRVLRIYSYFVIYPIIIIFHNFNSDEIIS